MRLTFDCKTPVSEQLLRSSARKKVGRKHCHKKGPGKAANDSKNHRVNVAKYQSAKARIVKNKISAYWRGDLESYPD